MHFDLCNSVGVRVLVVQVNDASWEARLVYTDTREEEEVDLSLLVKDQHIAFSKRSCKPGCVIANERLAQNVA